MKPVAETYRDNFFRRRKSLAWRAPILCSIIKKIFPEMDSVIDVGCAIGEFVKEFSDNGIRAKGIEGSISAKPYFLPGANISVFDIRQPLSCSLSSVIKVWGLCMCLEVAEHIEKEYVEIFLDNLCFLSASILISAAPPGQQGHGHHNCQPKEYWDAKFKTRHYFRNAEKEKYFKALLEPYKRKKGLNGYYGNTMIYEYRG